MIEVPMEWLVVVPLAASLAVLLVVSAYYAFRAQSREPAGRQVLLYRCSSCGRVYTDTRQVPMASCPRCGHLNPSVQR